MKSIVLFLAAFYLSFGFLSAVTQITSFGEPHGIVADTNEWVCTVETNRPKIADALEYVQTKHIRGTSKSLPMTFEFFKSTQNFCYQTSQKTLDKGHTVLAKYAIATNSIISNISIKENSNTHYIINGSFFENKSTGHFALHVISSYIMFVELRSELFDESTREIIMNKPFELITHLYNPKKLSALLGIDFEEFSNCIILGD
jgi:hypothetical protein